MGRPRMCLEKSSQGNGCMNDVFVNKEVHQVKLNYEVTSGNDT